MLLYVVMQHLKHRGIFVGIDDIPHVQAQRFIAIDRYPRGNKFVPSVFDFRKKVDDLPAVKIDNFDRLPPVYFYFYAAARVDYIFFHRFPLIILIFGRLHYNKKIIKNQIVKSLYVPI